MPDVELLRAWCHTTYRVDAPDGPIDLRIGEPSAELDRLLLEHDADAWAFITASNPRSQQLSDADNARRNRELLSNVEAAGYVTFSGRGIGCDESWPPEDSLLVVGMTESAALQCARQFEQHAIVCGDRGGPARLSFCMIGEWRETVEQSRHDSDMAVRDTCRVLRRQLR